MFWKVKSLKEEKWWEMMDNGVCDKAISNQVFLNRDLQIPWEEKCLVKPNCQDGRF